METGKKITISVVRSTHWHVEGGRSLFLSVISQQFPKHGSQCIKARKCVLLFQKLKTSGLNRSVSIKWHQKY